MYSSSSSQSDNDDVVFVDEVATAACPPKKQRSGQKFTGRGGGHSLRGGHQGGSGSGMALAVSSSRSSTLSISSVSSTISNTTSSDPNKARAKTGVRGSRVWEFFEHIYREDGVKLAICDRVNDKGGKCNKHFEVIRGSTRNLSSHLETNHAELFKKLKRLQLEDALNRGTIKPEDEKNVIAANSISNYLVTTGAANAVKWDKKDKKTLRANEAVSKYL